MKTALILALLASTIGGTPDKQIPTCLLGTANRCLVINTEHNRTMVADRQRYDAFCQANTGSAACTEEAQVAFEDAQWFDTEAR